MGTTKKIYPRPNSGMGGFCNTAGYSAEIELRFKDQFVILKQIDSNDGVAMGRNDECFCGSGKKHKKCHSDISANSVAALLIKKLKLLDKTIAQERKAHEVQFVCEKGCSECCSDYFYISIVEYFYIKYWLLNNAPAEFESARAQSNIIMTELKEFSKKEYSRLFDVNATVVDAANAGKYITEFKNCVFLKDGACSIYPARPRICRIHGYTMSCAPCSRIASVAKDKDVMSILISLDTVHFDEGINRINTKHGVLDMRRRPIFYWLYKDSQYQLNYKDSLQMELQHYLGVHLKNK